MKNKTKPNDPINPAIVDGHETEGLTKREYFAIMALQGVQASNVYIPHQSQMDRREVAIYSVRFADILIEELNRQNDVKKGGK